MNLNHFSKTVSKYFPFLIPYLDKIAQSPIGQRLIKGSLWSTLGLFFSKGLEIFTFILVARILDKAKFGELGIIQSTISLFKIFAWFWLGTTATKFVSEFRDRDLEKTGRIIGLALGLALIFGLLFAIALLFSSPWIAARVLAAPQLSTPLIYSSVMLIFGSLIGVQNGILAGLENFKLTAIINLISGILTLPLLLIGAHYWGVTGAVWGLVFLMVINWYLNQGFLKKILKERGIKISFIGSKSEWNALFHFSFPTFLSSILVNPVNWICGAMLANQINGYPELGIFNAANQWRLAILFLPISLGAAILPILSNLKGSGQWTSFKKVVRASILLSAGLSFVIGLPIILLSSYIMGFYGSDFKGHQATLIFLALAAILNSITSTIGNSIASLNKMWWGFALNLCWGISLIIFAKFLVEKGAIGLSLATFYSYLVHLAMAGGYVYFLMVPRRPRFEATLSA